MDGTSAHPSLFLKTKSIIYLLIKHFGLRLDVANQKHNGEFAIMTNRIVATEADRASSLTRRGLLGGATATAVAAYLGRPRPARADNYKFGISLGWTGGESGRHFQYGYTDSLAKLGGTATVTDAGWDGKKQVGHIDSMVAASVDALFVTPSAAAVIAPAIQRALAAGIPVFASDSLVAGTAVTSTALSDNFGMGYYSANWMAKKLGGKGKVATVSLPQNETWDERTLGMKFAFSQYPQIDVVSNWAFALAGNVTPADAIGNVLSQHSDLDAVWSAWDGAAIDGSDVAKKLGRNSVFFTGIDGGTLAFDHLKQPDSGYKLCMAQSFYEMAYLNVFYAHELLAGRKVPRLVVAPVYAVTEEMLAGNDMAKYDVYDQPTETLGWTRVV
jgi:ribose transport system substrate-binding protein